MTRLVFEPLTGWPHPETARTVAPFSATWPVTRQLLIDEADQLGAKLVVLELDLTRADLRRDGEIRANARLQSGRVRVSLDTRHGPLQYAADRYFSSWKLDGWKANARAVALTLQALRAIDRYGALRGGEQYQGFRALPPPSARPVAFSSADEALQWMRAAGDVDDDRMPPRAVYRAAVRLLHPDVGGDRAEWDRLEQAHRQLHAAGLL